jgi:hypothetical protein
VRYASSSVVVAGASVLSLQLQPGIFPIESVMMLVSGDMRPRIEQKA